MTSGTCPIRLRIGWDAEGRPPIISSALTCPASTARASAAPDIPGRSASRAAPQKRPTSARAWTEKSRRSEEHTSELQSLMRISYAVFCLKKQKHIHPDTTFHNPRIPHTDDNINKHL